MRTRGFTPSEATISRIPAAITSARGFLAEIDYPLGITLLAHLVDGAPVDEVITALSRYQNDDGGFGRELEVDIAAPESNPFATRLAMTVLHHLQPIPEADEPMMASLAAWLKANQAPDGDWHLSAATRSGDLAPWFAAWEHPALNPALCVAGYAHRIGLSSPEMLAMTASLFDRLGSVEQAASADFYSLLPYVEYVDLFPAEERDDYIQAIAQNIEVNHGAYYADAGHFWEHVLAAGREVMALLPTELLESQVIGLLDEQEADGGWPSPYSPNWRPWATTMSACSLLRLRGQES